MTDRQIWGRMGVLFCMHSVEEVYGTSQQGCQVDCWTSGEWSEELRELLGCRWHPEPQRRRGCPGEENRVSPVSAQLSPEAPLSSACQATALGCSWIPGRMLGAPVALAVPLETPSDSF